MTDMLKHFKHKLALEISSIGANANKNQFSEHVSVRNKTMSNFNKNQLLPLDNDDLVFVSNYK